MQGTIKIGALAAATALLATACFVPYDFDGNGKADLAYVDLDGSWYRAGEVAPFFESADASLFELGVAGDYDGNGRWEAANLLTDGRWETAGARGTFTFDHPAVGPEWWQQAIPVPGNYHGGRATEAAWYLPEQATWIVEGQDPTVFGVPSSAAAEASDCSDWDVPVPADYDGDGLDDIAVYRPTDGTFHQFGVGEIAQVLPYGFPAPADYDGDGVDDPAVVGPVPVDISDPDPWDWVWKLELHITGQDPMAVDSATSGIPAPANYHGAPGDEFTVWDEDALLVEGMAPVTLTDGWWTASTIRPWLQVNVLRLTFIQNLYMVDEHCTAVP